MNNRILGVPEFQLILVPGNQVELRVLQQLSRQLETLRDISVQNYKVRIILLINLNLESVIYLTTERRLRVPQRAAEAWYEQPLAGRRQSPQDSVPRLSHHPGQVPG